MDNIRDVVKCSPDYVGFIFYEGSQRFVGENLDAEYLFTLNDKIKKTGVFVNADMEYILKKISEYKLDFVQLHGDESPEFCYQLSDHIKIIKAFGIDDEFDFNQLKNYKSNASYFLFDTKTKEHGGSGIHFDWEILKKYNNETPFFLSGGIDLNHIENILQIKEMNLHAIDVNSKFEIEPGLKDINKINLLKDAIHR